MSYYSLLGFIRDPFVTTPDPDLFFQCPHQVDILERLEIAVRLRRGLNVVLGPVGTGKSTLSRHFMRALHGHEEFLTLLMLDPLFESEREFLTWLNRECDVSQDGDASMWQLKDSLKNRLYALGVEQGRAVCLIIDEGQKISDECLEVLRELLNYETNEAKLLQVVIFAQTELAKRLEATPNLKDRIYQLLSLRPFSFRETGRMIAARMEKCMQEGAAPNPMFTLPGDLAVYLATGGYPRKITQLCHKVMLRLISHGRQRAGARDVLGCLWRERSPAARLAFDLSGFFLAALALGYTLGLFLPARAWMAKAALSLAGLLPR